MIYQRYNPCDELAPFIECYFIWDSESIFVENLIVESPPSGFCSIVFNCGDQYYLQNKKYTNLLVPQQFVAGQSIYSYKLFLKGHISQAGIVLKPAALATLFNLPTYQYTEERIDLIHIFPTVAINRYRKMLVTTSQALEKVKVLEAFMLHHFQANDPKPDFIDKAANLIVSKNGMLTVTEMMEDIYMSRRNFERRFFKKVGLSPKYYARIRRMAHLFNQMAGKHKVNWPLLLGECDHHDQSHFIKDFLEFTGRTPQQYLEENKELVHLVEKPASQSIQQ
jgi:AraC-like DNA-binding protein